MGSPVSPATKLIVLRGPSGCGKSTIARALRERVGRGLAVVEQDYLRRILLREHDRPGAANIGLIDQTVRYVLRSGFGVVLEGGLRADHYGPMLRRLVEDHRGRATVYYFDVPFAETVRRHAGRPQAAEFTAKDMRAWYPASTSLGIHGERLIDPGMPIAEVIERLVSDLVPLPVEALRTHSDPAP